MNKVLVVYRSKSGYTKKYAGWIAEAVHADLCEGKNMTLNKLRPYDTVIYGAALYATGINGIKTIKKYLDDLKQKQLIVFTLGATPVRPEIFEEVKNNNFTAEQQKQIRFFMLRGGFDFNKLTIRDKFLMTLLKMKLTNKKELNADERGMLAAYSQPMDFTNIKKIKPIIDAINEYIF